MASSAPPVTAASKTFLTRRQLLAAMPRHLFYAALAGAAAGSILNLMEEIELAGNIRVLLWMAMGAVYVNAAVLPIALPRRNWSFAFIGAMMLFLLLVGGFIIASKLVPHVNPAFVKAASLLTFLRVEAVLTGGCLGIFYGVFSAGRRAMICGVIVGVIGGLWLGFVLGRAVSYAPGNDGWLFPGPVHLAWQGALASVLLHWAACLGATLGAPESPPS